MRFFLLPLLPILGALASLTISTVFGPYWWTFPPALAGVGMIFAKGKGEMAERFDDKKQLTPEEREEIFRRVFKQA